MFKSLSFLITCTLILGSIISCSSIKPIAGRGIASTEEYPDGEVSVQPESDNLLTIESLTTVRPSSEPVIHRDVAAVEKSKLEPKKTVKKPSPKRQILALEYHDKLYDFWIHYFTKRQKKLFERHLRNGEKYKNLVMKIFREHGLPEDLFYLGLIESGFNTKIRSRANAVGPWQFIKGTARRYGLRVDRSVDERRHIHKATHAAARFLKDLYNIFGSWELALCAYNAGEYRIINAIRRGNTRDYKELVRKKLLPKETIYYVPKIAAAKELERNPDKYGLSHEPYGKKTIYNNVIAKTIYHNFSAKKLARRLKISYSKFRVLNMDLKHDYVRVRSTRPMTVYLPDTKRNRKISLNYKKYRKVATKSRQKTGVLSKSLYHKVKRGDSLTSLAAAYDVTISQLKKANRLRNNKIYKGQRLKIPTVRYKVYRVRRGDNLIYIAKKFKTTLSKIIKANALQSRVIYPRQKIIIPL
jgi:membrane-bound lytic murein transglycosylase D